MVTHGPARLVACNRVPCDQVNIRPLVAFWNNNGIGATCDGPVRILMLPEAAPAVEVRIGLQEAGNAAGYAAFN